MKKVFVFLLMVLFLVSCQRPATSTDWSPINDVVTPSPKPTNSTPQVTTTPTTGLTKMVEPAITSVKTLVPTSLPTLDFDTLPKELPSSLKGYELMSWQVAEVWNFTLITGTNREKTFEELMEPKSQVTKDGFVKITVAGIDQIKKVFELLPADQQILWSGIDLSDQVPEGMLYFTFPPQIIMDELIKYCKDRKITLFSLKESNDVIINN